MEHNLEEKEIQNFFEKYNILELNALKNILEYVHDYYYDMKKINKVFENVYNHKEQYDYRKNKNLEQENNFSLMNVLYNNSKLSSKELEFLYELVESAELYLSSVQECADGYNQEIDDFNIGEYPIIDIYKLEEKLIKELEKRKTISKKLVLKI